MEGLALSGNARVFEQEATTDDTELRRLRDKATADFGEIDPAISDTELESKLVDAYGMKARAEQIRAKYVAALAEDDQKRAARRREVADQVNRSRS
jgi:hypothetical protein